MRRKIYGTPQGIAEPQALDPASGFKVPHKNLVRQWDNEYVDRRFVDQRNPQDFVRGVRDDQNLQNARPESPDVYVLDFIQTEFLGLPISVENDIFSFIDTEASVGMITPDML